MLYIGIGFRDCKNPGKGMEFYSMMNKKKITKNAKSLKGTLFDKFKYILHDHSHFKQRWNLNSPQKTNEIIIIS